MKTLTEMLLQEQKTILSLLAKSNKNLSRYRELPDMHIQNASRNGYEQYYLYDGSSKKRTYVKHENLKQHSKLMQRDYELQVNRMLKQKAKCIEKNLKLSTEIDISDIKRLYSQMPSLKRKYITPIIETDEQYINKWMCRHPGQQNQYPEEAKYKTNRGEMVRSKSEKIIADTLDKYEIPYQYEPMLELGYSTIYPDFVTMNVKTGQTIYWEHLGLVSDFEYATKNFKKIQDYEKNRILLGRDLIITMESADVPLDIKLVEEKIMEHLL